MLVSPPDCAILHADKGDDANAIRQQVEERGVMPNIPPKAGPGGLHEIKHDGYRLIIARQGPRVRLLAGAAGWTGPGAIRLSLRPPAIWDRRPLSLMARRSSSAMAAWLS